MNINERAEAKKRLEYLRSELRAGRISYGEIVEIQDLASYIEEDTEPEGDKSEDDFDLKTEMETGAVITDIGYSVAFNDRFVCTCKTMEEAKQQVITLMEREQYWPNIFIVNDHGNVDHVVLDYTENKGKIDNISSRIIQSWV